MEERRNIWLPAGLESTGWEPDDRASQRRGTRAAKQSGETPKASGSWQPYDPNKPETKRSRPAPESGQAEPAARESDRAEPPTGGSEKAEPAARAEPEPERAPKDDSEQKDAAPGDARSTDPGGDSDQGRSDVDAMGQDKHRTVIGQRYGASRTKQIVYYGAFVAFVLVAYLGLKTAASHLDKAPAHDRDQAPWSRPSAPDQPLGGFTPRTQGEKGPTQFQ